MNLKLQYTLPCAVSGEPLVSIISVVTPERLASASTVFRCEGSSRSNVPQLAVIGFNGAETNCRIARILGILLMNRYFEQQTISCLSSFN